MKSRSLRRAGAALPALALVFSLLAVPAAAADIPNLSVTASPAAIESGGNTTLELTGMPSDARVGWSCNPQILTLSPSATGTSCEAVASTVTQSTTVTVTAVVNQDSTGDSGTATCTVTVTPLSVTVTPDAASVPAGGEITLTAQVLPDSVADKGIIWSCSNSSVRLSSTTGASTTVSLPSDLMPGTTFNVEARSNASPGVSNLCVIRVSHPRAPSVKEVRFTSPDTVEYKYVDPDRSFTLNAAAYPSDADEEDRKIIWSSSDTSVATVDSATGRVTGVAPGRAAIRATASADAAIYAEREVEVSGLLLSYIKKSTSGGRGETVQLSASSVVDIFQYRDISVSYTAFGNAREQTVNWESSNNTVASVIAGRVTGNFPGTGAVITASAAGTGYYSSFKVNVLEDVADAINVNMGSEPSYAFSGILSQLNARSQSKAGGPLDCVYNLKVSTGSGTLFYRYNFPENPGHGVGGTERYYYQPSGQGQMALRDVSFVPLPGFNGTAVVDYNAASTNGTTFSGTIRIEAAASSGVNYSTQAGQPVSFAAEHFSAICKGFNGQALRYVTFTLPSSSRGTLYYNYSPTGQFSQKVNSNTRYYASSNPSIDSITFVPADGFVGNVEIPYRCVDSAGAIYSGTVTVRVYGSGGQSGGGGSSDVEYYLSRNQQRTLNANDFNSASQNATGGSLNRIRFDSLPSSGAGTLYLNYTGTSSTRVTAGSTYYRGSSPRISSITFVPASGYTGTVSIPFTGTNTQGASFSGSLIFHVGESGGTGTVTYSTRQNQAVPLSAWDFNDASRRATGTSLNYIRFTGLPSSGAGTLYYNYVSAGSPGSRVSVNTDYRRNGTPALSGITFVPASGYAGTVSIPFTGYDDNGSRFSGTLVIYVEGGSVPSSVPSSVIRYTGSSLPISLRSADFQNACNTALGNPLASVQFNALPAAGRLYQNYSSPAQPGAGITAGTRYGAQEVDRIRYVPRAEYQGTLTVPYTLYDTQGRSYSASMELQLSSGYSSSSFSDTASGWDWAKPSIEFLRSSGITSGYRDNTYRPGQSISRGEFTLMICRAFQFPTGGSSGFPDVPAGSTYAGAVAAARDLGIVQGSNGRFHPDRPITRQSAMTMICRALNAAGQSLPAADTSLLSSYADGARVSAFARPSVAALVQSGAVRGNSAMRLNPGAAISRAEMAVILHRVLTR